MTNRITRTLAAAGLTLAGLAATTTAQAQVTYRTGAVGSTCTLPAIDIPGTPASPDNAAVANARCDAQWSLRVLGISNGSGGTGGTPNGGPSALDTRGTDQRFAQAAFITSTPTPPWAPNTPTQQWIGARANGSIVPNTMTAVFGYDNYAYIFQSAFTFSGGAGQEVRYTFGWDNRLLGAFIGDDVDFTYDAATGAYTRTGGGFDLLALAGITSPAFGGRSGFCRTPDGAATAPSCLVSGSVILPQNVSGRLTFVIQGDGNTDGLLVSATVVPEPSTYAMLGLGLAGLAGVVRRRKQTAA